MIFNINLLYSLIEQNAFIYFIYLKFFKFRTKDTCKTLTTVTVLALSYLDSVLI